ncbi:hypothetical protein C5S31_08330 [ANME-1 cluster archaeon GoMg2]|nr:hypothetical protein [ANME-1 cluster archaeon GoMg2]
MFSIYMDATRRMSIGLLFVLFLVLLVSATNAVAEPTTFFGEDSGLGEDDRLTSTPKADAARADFITQLSNPGTEKFESFAEGAEAPLAVDFGAAGTATLQGTGKIVEVPTDTDGYGRYPISGDKYWKSGGSFYVEFSKPEAAFGFYGVDVGDFHGQLTIAYEDGSAQTVTIPHTVDSPGGTVIYFGFIDLDKPFTKITFGNTAEGAEEEDVFGFDDFTIGTREQVELTPSPSPTPTPTTRSTTPLEGGILSPDTLVATLNPGESVTETKTYTTAEGKPITKVDVLFEFDLTGSMTEELSTMQTESQNIMNSLLESVPDSAFGVASFMDYSCYDARSNDYPWELNKRITTSTNAVRDAIIGLTLGDGGDYPEAYTRALYESYADSGVNWRTGAKKIALMFGDNIPHYPDPGRDGKVGTADDLDFDEVVAELKSQGITVLALHSGTDDIPWKHMADETGGHYYKLGHAEASKIPEAITSMLVAEVETIGELTLRAEPDYESWVSFTPNKYKNVCAKTTKTFTVKVTVPEGTKGGTYKFNIDVLGDGTVLETQEVTITTVREPTPSPSPSPTPTPTRTSTHTPTPTRTPKPTLSVVPTRTPTPTSAPAPTSTPRSIPSFEPAISVLPTSHNFGSMYVDGTSSPMMFIITNTGSEDLMIGPFSIKGVDDDEFRIRDNNCRGRAIAQSRSCTVNVLFAPTSEGEKSASLRILSNDPDTPTLNVPLEGTAVISEQESQLRNCNVAIKENGDTIISFLYDLSPPEEAAWLAGRFEIARTIENELRRIYNEDAAIITISAIETTVIIPNLIEPMDKTYTMPELNLQDIERRYKNLTISLIPTTVTIEFPDKYTETFVETDIVPETTHTISGVIIPWILICSPPSGAKLRNATTINVWGSDDIQRVSLLITGVGGEKRLDANAPPFYFEWNPNDTNVSGGSYQIEATGFVDDEGDVPVTYSIIVDVEKPMVPPATLFGVLIVFITAGVVAAGAAASSLRTTTEMRGRNGTGKWDVKLTLNQSILYGKYRTTIIGDILRVMLSIGILAFACTLQNELPKRTVATFSIPFYKEVPFLVPTFEGFGPNALSTFFSILVLVGTIILAREFVQHFLAWVLDAEVGAVMDKTSTVVVLGSGLFGLAVGKPMRPIIWDDLSSRVKGVICLGNILCLFSLFALFYYAVSGRLIDDSWMHLVKNVAIPTVAMLLMTSLIPFGGREGTAIFEWNKPLAISLFVISGLLYISLILRLIDPLTLSYSIGMVALAGSVVLIGGVLFYKFMEWINLV